MIAFLVLLTIVVSSVWVYLDATNHKIGKAPGSSNSAGAWGVATLLIWIIAFPAYLIMRGKLIENAKQHPVEVSGTGTKAGVLGAVGGIILLPMLLAGAEAELPSCDSAEVIGTIDQVDSQQRAGDARFISVSNISEQGFNQGEQIRACAGMIVTTASQRVIAYNVRWQDRHKGMFHVEVRGL